MGGVPDTVGVVDEWAERDGLVVFAGDDRVDGRGDVGPDALPCEDDHRGIGGPRVVGESAFFEIPARHLGPAPLVDCEFIDVGKMGRERDASGESDARLVGEDERRERAIGPEHELFAGERAEPAELPGGTATDRGVIAAGACDEARIGDVFRSAAGADF